MAGVHLLIGIGEGVITALTVMAVARVRPDLVYALRGLPGRSGAVSATPVLGGAR
jgi:cobalt/nickel transport system permease protein